MEYRQLIAYALIAVTLVVVATVLVLRQRQVAAHRRRMRGIKTEKHRSR